MEKGARALTILDAASSTAYGVHHHPLFCTVRNPLLWILAHAVGQSRHPTVEYVNDLSFDIGHNGAFSRTPRGVPLDLLL